MSDEIMVSISSMVYNQADYIKECLEGMLMQKCNFKFEILIHDDASTDGTEEIIREYQAKYPDIIKPLYEKENQWSKGIKGTEVFNLPRAKGKYITFCEGDDYWTDPLKLQKQVDFLETHPEYGLVCTEHDNYIQEKGKMYQANPSDKSIDFTTNELLIYNRIGTPTVCLRKAAYLEYVKEVNPQEKKWLMGDYPLWLWVSLNYKIKKIPDITCVYRILKVSASHNPNPKIISKFIDSSMAITDYFIKTYHIKLNEEERKQRETLFNKCFYYAYRDKNYSKAKHYMNKCDKSEFSFTKRLKTKCYPIWIIRFWFLKILRNN